jgi:hypothetical protein
MQFLTRALANTRRGGRLLRLEHEVAINQRVVGKLHSEVVEKVQSRLDGMG